MESPNSTLTPSIDKENELRVFATILSVSYREGGEGGGGGALGYPSQYQSGRGSHGYLEKYN